MMRFLKWFGSIIVFGLIAIAAFAAWIAFSPVLVVLVLQNPSDEEFVVTAVKANGKTKYGGPPVKYSARQHPFLQRGLVSFKAPREEIILELGIIGSSGVERQMSCVFDNSDGPCAVTIWYRGDGTLSCFCDSDRVS